MRSHISYLAKHGLGLPPCFWVFRYWAADACISPNQRPETRCTGVLADPGRAVYNTAAEEFQVTSQTWIITSWRMNDMVVQQKSWVEDSILSVP